MNALYHHLRFKILIEKVKLGLLSENDLIEGIFFDPQIYFQFSKQTRSS